MVAAALSQKCVLPSRAAVAPRAARRVGAVRVQAVKQEQKVRMWNGGGAGQSALPPTPFLMRQRPRLAAAPTRPPCDSICCSSGATDGPGAMRGSAWRLGPTDVCPCTVTRAPALLQAAAVAALSAAALAVAPAAQAAQEAMTVAAVSLCVLPLSCRQGGRCPQFVFAL